MCIMNIASFLLKVLLIGYPQAVVIQIMRRLCVAKVRKNLSLDISNVVSWCKSKIQNPNSSILRKGKNYYINTDTYVITVNTYNYTIITAHMIKK